MKYKAYFDGATRAANPDQMAIGWYIVESGKIIKEYSEELGYGTNNEAEYSSLISLLEYIITENLCDIIIYGDSNLIVNQVRGTWSVKSPNLQKYHEKASKLYNIIDNCNLNWIPRNSNTKADELSKSPFKKEIDKGILERAKKVKLEHIRENIWIAHGSKGLLYAIDSKEKVCSCMSWRQKKGMCKHLIALITEKTK
jgi:ribonuclease HI